YCRLFSPEAVTRVSSRFINVLRLPVKNDDFSPWLQFRPQTPGDLPNDANSFLTRLVVPYPKTQCQVVINEIYEGETDKSGLKEVILDIDVIKEIDREPNDLDGLKQELSLVRETKNMVFFNSITE